MQQSLRGPKALMSACGGSKDTSQRSVAIYDPLGLSTLVSTSKEIRKRPVTHLLEQEEGHMTESADVAIIGAVSGLLRQISKDAVRVVEKIVRRHNKLVR
jgi:hypothetical protein